MQDDIHSEFQKLKEEKDFLQLIVDELPATLHIIKIDDDGNSMPIWINKQYQNIIGYTIEERNKMSPLDLYHPDDIEQVRDAIKYAFSEKVERGNVLTRIKNKIGEWKWIYIYGKTIKYKSEGKFMLCVSVEVTQELALNHNKVKEYMKEINRLKSQLILSKLTPIEKEIICLLADGKSVKELAIIRNRSYETINNHKRNIFKKLGFNKLSELVSFCAENGLI